MNASKSNENKWWGIIGLLVILISLLHYTTPTMKWQYHLIFMQSYFIPILLGAFQFGVRGGLGTAIVVSIFYFPHIMFQWGGLVEANLMRFLQILLFNIIGYLTGLKAQKEKEEKIRFRDAAEKLKESIQKLKEQSNQMEEMEDQLRQADRLSVIGELSASLAHEVRNPLGSIRGIVDILKDESGKNQKSYHFLDILRQETERLNQVVENYLNFARMSPVHKVPFDAREVIRDSLLLLASKARKSGIKLEGILPEISLPVTGDPGQLQQVMMNLLLNALQVLPRGGEIKVEAASRNPENQGAAENQATGEEICISISDNGPGIRHEESEKIFKPFFTTREGGTGLGLAIVKRITDHNRWRIEVESQAGQGTTFHLFLPSENRTDSGKQGERSANG